MALKNFIRVGSRGSRLALAQAGQYLEILKTHVPGLSWEVVTIETSGDRFGEMAPTQVLEQSGKGIFVKEIEEALLAGTIDCAIHSLKDLPADTPPGLILCGYQRRADPRDALVTADGRKLEELPEDAIVGSSSLRRQMQFLEMAREMNKNWTLAPIRGNVDTRVKKVRDGKVDAVILSAAGIHRLGLQEYIAQYFDPIGEMTPPCGQGTLVVEICGNRSDLKSLFEMAQDTETKTASEIERATLKAVGGGCLQASGIYARPVERDQGDRQSHERQMELHFYHHSGENPQENGFRASLRVSAGQAGNIPELLASQGNVERRISNDE